MTPFSTLLASMTQTEKGCEIVIPPDWQQGRTTYGGLSAALCVAAARQMVPDLPPLRTAQFAFIGPAAGAARIDITVLRRGKSTVFLAADLHAEQSLATHATLGFAARRDARVHHVAIPMPSAPAPLSCPNLFPPGAGPVFSQHFDYHRVSGMAAPEPAYLLWLRHRDDAAPCPDSVTALVALADAPPPAAMPLTGHGTAISTMTWSLDLLEVPEAPLGAWRLLSATAEATTAGYSTQAMTVWSETGAPLLVARQTIALFT